MKEEQSPYLRLIQKTGFTRHPGGFDATDILLSRTHLSPDSHVLDVGCGAGHTMAHVAKTYGCQVTGVDISPEAIAKASALYHKEPFFSAFDLVEGSVLSLPFADNSFDVVLCESVLVFIKDKAQGLRELARVCKPQGFLALNELCANDEGVKDYFARPEMGIILCAASKLKEPLEKDFSMILYDEKAFNLSEQLWALKQYGNMNGALQLLEGFHHILTDQESRSDFLKILKLSLVLPKSSFNSLNWLMLLMQKK